MRNDVWHEYDNGLPNMDGVSNFDASITSYEAGKKYQSGMFITAEALGLVKSEGTQILQYYLF